jgi:2-polyprenyl-6-hydroxyphenyl methylase/3-demethylubiquinone-9 3-methyltransferase
MPADHLSTNAPKTEVPFGAMTRFRFGDNWLRFAELIDRSRIDEAVSSIREMLHVSDLDGRSFLDVGSGSGLFSLAAAELGATQIRSFDYDEDSVSCTRAVRDRFFPAKNEWTVERGDILDIEYCRTLPSFDVVYAWGVLHHTGAMWKAMEHTCGLVAPGGLLFLSIYNDQGRKSDIWRSIKHRYNTLPALLRGPFAVFAALPIIVPQVARALLKGQMLSYVRSWVRPYGRGMSPWHDLIDWIGGYPFEVAATDEVFRFYRSRGFSLVELRSVGGASGCNEFVFVNDDPA